MSDDDRDNDIESDADKRAHHNALERKRRDHIEDSFTMLRDALPFFQGDKNDFSTISCKGDAKRRQLVKRKERASRAQILKKAADYITTMRRKNSAHQQDIDDLKKQNKLLEDQIRKIENSKSPENLASAAAAIEQAQMTLNSINYRPEYVDPNTSDSDESSDESLDLSDSPRKRLKASSE